jgi:hypothetical protein
MNRPACNPFPHDPGYLFGDANCRPQDHLPIIPAFEETPAVTSQPEIITAPVPGDAGQETPAYE